MKKILLLILLFAAGDCSFAQETFPVNGTSNNNHIIYAFINAKIIVNADETIENGTMIVQNGIISGVGTKIMVPKGAVI